VVVGRRTGGGRVVGGRRGSEGGVGGARAEPELHLGLQLLARGAGRLVVAVGAGERFVPGIGRTFGVEAGRLRRQHGRRRGQYDGGTEPIGNELDRTLVRGDGCRLRHVNTTVP